MLDYLYYKDTYGGEMTEGEFTKILRSAYDVIALMIGKESASANSEPVLRALCLQADHLSRVLSENVIKKESLGDYSVTYDRSAGVAVSDISLSGEAIAALRCAGLLTRWA